MMHGAALGSAPMAQKEGDALSDLQLESLEEEADEGHGAEQELLVRSSPKRSEEQEHLSGTQKWPQEEGWPLPAAEDKQPLFYSPAPAEKERMELTPMTPTMPVFDMSSPRNT